MSKLCVRVCVCVFMYIRVCDSSLMLIFAVLTSSILTYMHRCGQMSLYALTFPLFFYFDHFTSQPLYLLLCILSPPTLGVFVIFQ